MFPQEASCRANTTSNSPPTCKVPRKGGHKTAFSDVLSPIRSCIPLYIQFYYVLSAGRKAARNPI